MKDKRYLKDNEWDKRYHVSKNGYWGTFDDFLKWEADFDLPHENHKDLTDVLSDTYLLVNHDAFESITGFIGSKKGFVVYLSNHTAKFFDTYKKAFDYADKYINDPNVYSGLTYEIKEQYCTLGKYGCK